MIKASEFADFLNNKIDDKIRNIHTSMPAKIVKFLNPNEVSIRAESPAKGIVIVNKLLCIIELLKSPVQLKPKLLTKWLKNLLIIFKIFL